MLPRAAFLPSFNLQKNQIPEPELCPENTLALEKGRAAKASGDTLSPSGSSELCQLLWAPELPPMAPTSLLVSKLRGA